MQQDKNKRFPKNFLWGASSSAHQYEGGNHNQWSVWELENAKSLAARAPYLYGELSNWKDIETEAKNPQNYVSGKANNHYEKFIYDFEILKMMNMNAWRFSIEWSRVQPNPATWNVEAINHYKEYIAALKERNIEPIVTLFHFSLPVWFAEMGGFEKRSNIKFFVQYAERMLEELGSAVKFVITINEPEVYAAESYIKGVWPPMVQSNRRGIGVIHNLAIAHNKVADMAHKMSPRYKIAISKNSAFYYPGDDSRLSVRSAAIMQYFQDDYLLKKVIKKSDFISVNYYFSNRVYGYRVHNPNQRLSDMGWDLSPEHLEHALERLSEKYNKPIFVTENGLADADDEHRKWWISETLEAINRSMKKGVPVIGYLHWSLLDNFEWDKGAWPRFGLFEVDYKTMKRKPRPSAIWYSKVIKKLRG